MKTKNIITILSAFLILLSVPAIANDSNSNTSISKPAKYEGLVILEIENLDDVTYIEIQKALEKENNSNLNMVVFKTAYLSLNFSTVIFLSRLTTAR